MMTTQLISPTARRWVQQACLVALAFLIIYVEIVESKSRYKKKKKRDPSKGQRYFWWAVSVVLGLPVCIFIWNVIRDPALPRLFKLAWNKCRGRLSKKLTSKDTGKGGTTSAAKTRKVE